MFDLKNVSLATLMDLELMTFTDAVTAPPERIEGASDNQAAVLKELRRRGYEPREHHRSSTGFDPWKEPC